ncbi:DNA cytosine methyltransferase [Candidatus Marinimicrobia bacterium MT.SAG.2]|nr:DNA cytosine methyltransferase [Candidatus Marinimicrobia bacterium MT.SAG.2]
MIGVDIFAGVGGMSLGAAYSKIDVKVAIENDPYAAATYKFNHPKTKVIVEDIRSIRIEDLPKSKKSKVLFGGSPCQGFSTSNQKTRNKSNPSSWLLMEFIRIAKIWHPEWIVFENVKGIVETSNGLFLYKLKQNLSNLGYTLSEWILNAADYGVPQKRNRYFLIGSINGIIIDKPISTNEKRVTVRDAIYDLPILDNGSTINTKPYRKVKPSNYAKGRRNGKKHIANNLVTKNSNLILDRYKYVPQGGNWRDIPLQLMSNYSDSSRCHSKIYHRLKWDEESVVIGNYRKNMLIHPEQDRGLSVREAARLQSFPDAFEFKGSVGFQQQQVGNAVPPFLAKKVFNGIQNSM